MLYTPEWRSIPSFPAYEISDSGLVRRVAGGKGSRVKQGQAFPLLSPYTDKDGYARVALREGGRVKDVSISRLILSAFVGEPFEGAEAAHRNGDPTDNRVANLYWATPVQNAADKREHGTAAKGERHGLSKLTEDDVRAIRSSPAKASDIAPLYGVSRWYINDVRRRRTWAHVTP